MICFNEEPVNDTEQFKQWFLEKRRRKWVIATADFVKQVHDKDEKFENSQIIWEKEAILLRFSSIPTEQMYLFRER
jgi:hypothetical protein